MIWCNLEISGSADTAKKNCHTYKAFCSVLILQSVAQLLDELVEETDFSQPQVGH